MIQNTNIKSDNIFSIFPEYNTGLNLLPKDSLRTAVPDRETAVDEVKLKTSSNSGTKRKILFGSTIASTILTAGILGLVFIKGSHSNGFKKKISEYTAKLAHEIQESSQTTKNLPQKIIYHQKRAIKKVLDFLQATSNFTTFKDYGSNKALNKIGGPAKAFSDKSTSFFRRIVDRTLGKKYNRVEVDINDLASLLKEYDIKTLRSLDASQLKQKIKIKGTTRTLEEWINLLEKEIQRMESTFDKNFSRGARKLRGHKRLELLKNLPKKIHDRFFSKGKQSLLNINNYKTYATEDLARPVQEELRRDIITAKKQISNNIPSISEQIRSNLKLFSDTVKPGDETSRTTIQTLRQKLEMFKNCSGEHEAKARENITKEIISVIDDFVKKLTDNTSYSTEEQQRMRQFLSEIKDDLISCGTNGSKGALEEIMTILKGLSGTTLKGKKGTIISQSSYKDFSKLSGKISKELKKATDLEIGEYFLKQAELTVGSAPTDVASVLLPIGTGAYAITKGDNKDERISATLTTCIPLVGTFATFVYGTTKMFSGAKNLIFSAVSGLALGIVGEYCDKLYKKYKNPKETVTNVVKDGYDKFWTGLESQIHKFDEPETDKTKK